MVRYQVNCYITKIKKIEVVEENNIYIEDCDGVKYSKNSACYKYFDTEKEALEELLRRLLNECSLHLERFYRALNSVAEIHERIKQVKE